MGGGGPELEIVSSEVRCHTATTSSPRSPEPRPQASSFLIPRNSASYSMTGGVALSEDLRGVLIRMHILRGIDTKSISYFTGIPLRTVQHVVTTWKRMGEAKPAPEGVRGRPRVLDFADTQVRLCFPTEGMTPLTCRQLVSRNCRHSTQ